MLHYESGHAAVDVTVRCAGRLVPVVLAIALVFFCVGWVIEDELAAGPGDGNGGRNAVINAYAHVEGDEAERVEEPVGGGEGPEVVPVGHEQVLDGGVGTFCWKRSPEVATSRMPGR